MRTITSKQQSQYGRKRGKRASQREALRALREQIEDARAIGARAYLRGVR